MSESSFSRAERRIISIVMDSIRGDGFAIAGDAAMLASGFSHRPTEGLDALSATCGDVGSVAQKATRALVARGADVDVEQATESAASLIVSTGERRRTSFRVELARRNRLFEAASSSLGPVLSLRELAADMILAASSRHRLRDLFDLHALAAVTPIDQAFVDAQQKDPGFDRAVFDEMVGQTAASEVDRWLASTDVDPDLDTVRAFVTSTLLGSDHTP